MHERLTDMFQFTVLPYHAIQRSCKLNLENDNNIIDALLAHFRNKINDNVFGIWYDESPHDNDIGVNVSNGDLYIIYPEDCTYAFKRKNQNGLNDRKPIF
ncbi:hypothetical protein ROZALSC1DRAFT_28823 [Rozella allomycis CSF55]|uniref:Uncharacterized protein n=1 Tax=Rozella allomycis (strain CSF55) TaxID=988480 RepID=A0A4P9YJ24_ROZAC|nr:hypothetical protein ROZALSC1DRAFT_28823 [Rozella allomycis CSF55]